MLKLVLGRAGSGKTTYAMDMFRSEMEKGRQHLYFIVPEQYSHDAERQLLKICGDTLSLRGEVLSFSRLCSRVFAETGGLGAKMLDDGGRILLMSRAVSNLSGRLRMYGKNEQTADFLERLVAVSKEFKSACVTPDDLEKAAAAAESPLREKLLDLQLITAAYDACFTGDMADPDGRLGRLAGAIKDSAVFDGGHLWFDGFTDFTAQELRVIEELMKKDAGMTVCLTCDGLVEREEIFEPARKTALKLLRMASTLGVGAELVTPGVETGGKADALLFLEKNLFLYDSEKFEGDSSAVEIFRALTPDLECEYAAAKVLALLREGYRLRDIAVAVCDWGQYGALAENIFEKYGVDVFVGNKEDIRAMPPVALVEYALEIVTGGWEYEAVFAYLKTGLTGLVPDDVDALENYVLKWNLKGGIWARDEDWTLPPSGYEDQSGGDAARLQRINALRRAVMLPLRGLQRALKSASTYGEKIRAVYYFLEKLGLPERIAEKSAAFLEKGELQLSDTYAQLWDVLIRAMEQFYEILGDAGGSTAEFLRLWKLLISQYDLGSIPISLDRAGLGDMTRIRRRGSKCLIVIGASDDALPAAGGGDGLLSDGERRDILSLGLTLPGSAEERLYRALSLIYAALTIPSDRLVVTYPRSGAGGGEKRPSFVVRRLRAMFSLEEQTDDACAFRQSARLPAFELAASHRSGADGVAAAAAEYFKEQPETAGKLDRIAGAKRLDRGRLSTGRASALYGQNLVMSASRIDKFYACRFLYFLQYGLNARPRKPYGFDAPTAGTFMHYLLENVTREIRDGAGFDGVTDAECLELTSIYVEKYVTQVLDNFKDKSSRFKYLFNRLVKDASFIVLDMVRELKNSGFRPLDFELGFSDTAELPPYVLAGGGMDVKIKGFVDRVDGWEHNGRLYLRIVDYKTGKKSFSLSDVLYGMNMQMLIYLFSLHKNGAARYGGEIVPAGVLYAPAREELIQASRDACDEEIADARAKKLRRSGLILGDDDVIEAMEHGPDKKYLPVKRTKDGLSGESLAGLEQMGRLSKHIDTMLLEIAGNVRKGAIQAEPYFKNQNDNACLFCDFAQACHFSEADGDRRRYLKKVKTDEAWHRIMGEAEE
ncbi:ATP-dependent helicase/nuclease subunit B [Sporobacter termitidis DSM 10068]|uniref:ATP-dependent helicase/nuclease subunit B n=1 Tax=Sporobacter termitidis DSM 10068 TaxID=1123282 RepID=A0A1M5X7S8_9FIRM|nr:PD-(D/E)XK nuclease family protein [Sporobacter termitidis]SHH95273.1 ATP-dependent helicase/nuclease subunit B [Sporobacter termitidis DSM 10068]